jgi:hypothetical protein
MKVEGYLFAFIAVFLGGVDVIYWFTSHDPTGTTALALGAGLGTLTGFYLLFTARRIEPRPEDLDDADISDGAGELAVLLGAAVVRPRRGDLLPRPGVRLVAVLPRRRLRRPRRRLHGVRVLLGSLLLTPTPAGA